MFWFVCRFIYVYTTCTSLHFFYYAGNPLHSGGGGKHQWRSLYSAYISVMNRDIFPLTLQIFINDTSAQFTLKCIFSHRGFLCLSWYLSNWETLKNGYVLTQQARRIQIILFLPLCGNNVNIYRSGKLSGVFNEWEKNHSLCADTIFCLDPNIHQLVVVAPMSLN